MYKDWQHVSRETEAWSETPPIRGYVDGRFVEVPEIPLLDKIIMGWDKKKDLRRAAKKIGRKNYRDSHPEYVKRQAERYRQWKLDNPEKYEEYKRAFIEKRRAEGSERFYSLEYGKRYREKHKEKLIQLHRDIRARKGAEMNARRKEIRELKKAGLWPQQKNLQQPSTRST